MTPHAETEQTMKKALLAVCISVTMLATGAQTQALSLNAYWAARSDWYADAAMRVKKRQEDYSNYLAQKGQASVAGQNARSGAADAELGVILENMLEVYSQMAEFTLKCSSSAGYQPLETMNSEQYYYRHMLKTAAVPKLEDARGKLMKMLSAEGLDETQQSCAIKIAEQDLLPMLTEMRVELNDY